MIEVAKTTTRLVLLGCLLAPRAGAAPAWCAVDDPARARTSATAATPCPEPADPQTLPDQLALPLPCFGYLLMRKVVVSASTVLDDAKIYLGGPPPDPGAPPVPGLVDGPHIAVLAGGFNQGDGPRNPQHPVDLSRLKGRSYYLATYPMTEPQLRRIRLIGDEAADPAEAACQAEAAKPGAGGVRPATGLSWFDANDAIRRYQGWLLAHDRAAIAARKTPALPWEQGSPAYLRLPTEAEWEFAARGGAAGQEDQARPFYTVRDPASGAKREAVLEEVARLREAGGAEEHGPPRLGRTLPNVLGLYDLLGAVEQITLEPFHLTRPDEMAGQTGGYVVKGGNALTSARVLGVGHRREVPYFDLNGETRSAWVGFRPVLSVPVFVGGVSPDPQQRFAADRPNERLVDAMAAARVKLVTSKDADRGQAAAGLDALRTQAGTLDQQDLHAQLDAIKAALDRSNARLSAADEAAQQERLEGAVLLAANLRALRHSNDTHTMLVGMLSSAVKDEFRSCLPQAEGEVLMRRLDYVRDRIEDFRSAVPPTYDYYLSRLQEMAALPQAERNAASDAVRRAFQGRSLGHYETFQQVVDSQTDLLAKAGGVSPRLRQSWSDQIYNALRTPTQEPK